MPCYSLVVAVEAGSLHIRPDGAVYQPGNRGQTDSVADQQYIPKSETWLLMQPFEVAATTKYVERSYDDRRSLNDLLARERIFEENRLE